MSAGIWFWWHSSRLNLGYIEPVHAQCMMVILTVPWQEWLKVRTHGRCMCCEVNTGWKNVPKTQADFTPVPVSQVADFHTNTLRNPWIGFPSCPDLPKFKSNPGFQFSQVSSLDIALLLRSLPSGKSAGPDNITNELLKLSAPAISESLAAIVNDSLTLGIFPPILERVDCVTCAESWQKCHKACVESSNLPPLQHV